MDKHEDPADMFDVSNESLLVVITVVLVLVVWMVEVVVLVLVVGMVTSYGIGACG